MHPSDRLRGASSRLLEGKTIVLGVTGSIAAVKAVELCRELLRHGARVIPVMTAEATRILHPNALEFATGEKPVTALTGAVEHVRDMGAGPGKADLFLVAPCTGNTLSKMALGIDDSPVTTYFTTGFTTTPVLVAPAMHETMYDHPFLVQNLARLKEAGVHVVEPTLEEGKAKLAQPERIVEHVLRLLGPGSLRGRRILVINGSTVEALDQMRVVTNRSTGRMGAALVQEAFRMGADVEHWFGHGHLDRAPDAPTRRFVTVADLLDLAPHAKGFDAVLVPAAISDFGPAPAEGKIPSEGEGPILRLKPLPKVLHELRKHVDGLLVSFKAESGVDEAELVARARRSQAKAGSAFVVANLLEEVQPGRTRALLVDRKEAVAASGSKEEVARRILERLAQEWSG